MLGLSGLAGSGKTQAAILLCQRSGVRVEVLSFASPMKNMMRDLMKSFGILSFDAEAYLTIQKETPIPEMGGVTMRRMLRLPQQPNPLQHQRNCLG